jgi:hypothetical protein
LTSNEASTARFSRWVVNRPNFDRNSVFSLASTEAAPACLARGHWRWLSFCPDRRPASTSLPPLAPSPLRDFTATMEALTPVRPALRPLPEHRLCGQQVSLIHASGPPIIPSPTTLGLPPSLSHPTPQRVGLLTYVSPGFATESQARQLSGRIAFVILRTDRSPPAAPHPASRTDAVAVGYRPERAYLKRTSTSLTKCAFRRTIPAFAGMTLMRKSG